MFWLISPQPLAAAISEMESGHICLWTRRPTALSLTPLASSSEDEPVAKIFFPRFKRTFTSTSCLRIKPMLGKRCASSMMIVSAWRRVSSTSVEELNWSCLWSVMRSPLNQRTDFSCCESSVKSVVFPIWRAPKITTALGGVSRVIWGCSSRWI